MSNSAKYNELGHPFGYLKASTALNCVNLFVMPYNYPVLLPLLGKSFLSVLLHNARNSPLYLSLEIENAMYT